MNLITSLSPAQLRRAADIQERIQSLQAELSRLLGEAAPASAAYAAPLLVDSAAAEPSAPPMGDLTVKAARIWTIKVAGKPEILSWKFAAALGECGNCAGFPPTGLFCLYEVLQKYGLDIVVLVEPSADAEKVQQLLSQVWQNWGGTPPGLGQYRVGQAAAYVVAKGH